MTASIDPIPNLPIPNLPYVPTPPESGNPDLDGYRRAKEKFMSELGRWPRLGYGFFDRAPTAADDDSFGYERGFVWVADIPDPI